jgi:GLPGLI family protein
MKTILTSLLAVTIQLAAMAQTPDKALSRVRYSLVHIRDTTHRDRPHTENMLLVIGKNASIFTSYDRLNRDQENLKRIQQQLAEQAGSTSININHTGSPSKPVTDIDYLYFAKENQLFTREKVFNNYLTEEDAPKIPWKIEKDTASFSGVKCKKATARFKGRNWIAWYAPELPFSSGPWKLSGLPGLIIEAYDEKKEVQFAFAGMENVDPEQAKAVDLQADQPNTTEGTASVKLMGTNASSAYLGSEIKLPAEVIITTRAELDRLKQARDQDPQGFINAQMAAANAQYGTNKKAVFQPIASTGPKKVVNNPIELPEKR